MLSSSKPRLVISLQLILLLLQLLSQIIFDYTNIVYLLII